MHFVLFHCAQRLPDAALVHELEALALSEVEDLLG
jgi:hypothetical protein